MAHELQCELPCEEGPCQAVQTGPKNSTALDAERAMAAGGELRGK